MSREILFTLLAVLLIASLCISPSQFFSFSIEGIEHKERVEKAVNDVLALQGATTIPKPPILAGQSFELYINLANLDETRTIKNVEVEVFDPSVFKLTGSSSQTVDLLPLDEKVVSFTLEAPGAEEIANVRITPKISYRVLYGFEALSSYEVVVVNKEEIKRLQQAGKSVSIVSNKILGSGPVKIYMELVGTDVMISGTTATLRVILKNEGSGYLKDERIEAGKLKLVFPSGITLREWNGKMFSCSGSTCENAEPIELFMRESPALIFKIGAPSISEPYKTFKITAKASYTYELRGSTDVTIQPLG